MPPERGPAAHASHRALIACIAAVVAMQVWLVFHKSFNWDEFFHFSQVYELKQGRLARDLQVLHARLFAWAALVPGGLVRQLEAARLGMLGCELAAAAALAGLARRFAGTEAALLAALAWLGGGYVFLHGFSFRADPMATAALMIALWLIGTRRLNLATAIMVGALIGVAGVMTVKSAIYAPCFAGLAWLRLREAEDRRGALLRLALVPVAAAAAFALTLALHRIGLALDHSAAESVGADRSRFFQEGLFPQWPFMLRQAIFAPALAIAVLAAPFAWRRAGLEPAERVALAGFLLPLLTLALYRNAFPYYYVFLLAPAAVAAAPLLRLLRARYGLAVLLALLMASPLGLLVSEPRAEMERQKTTIAWLEELEPKPVSYLSWSGIVPAYPRVFDFLTTGIGIERYFRQGQPRLAEAIHAGTLRFIVADHPVIAEALAGRPIPNTFPAADIEAMRRNFVQRAGAVWLPGLRACPGQTALAVDVAGTYTPDGSGLAIDGKLLTAGKPFALSQGSHTLSAPAGACVTLWAGSRIPPPPRASVDGPLYTLF